jgi:hypothetical protein
MSPIRSKVNVGAAALYELTSQNLCTMRRLGIIQHYRLYPTEIWPSRRAATPKERWRNTPYRSILNAGLPLVTDRRRAAGTVALWTIIERLSTDRRGVQSMAAIDAKMRANHDDQRRICRSRRPEGLDRAGKYMRSAVPRSGL